MLEWDSEWSGRNGIQVIVEVSERASNATSTQIEGKIKIQLFSTFFLFLLKV